MIFCCSLKYMWLLQGKLEYVNYRNWILVQSSAFPFPKVKCHLPLCWWASFGILLRHFVLSSSYILQIKFSSFKELKLFSFYLGCDVKVINFSEKYVGTWMYFKIALCAHKELHGNYSGKNQIFDDGGEKLIFKWNMSH